MYVWFEVSNKFFERVFTMAESTGTQKAVAVSTTRLLEVYKAVHAAGGTWKEICEQTGLAQGTASARIQGLKQALIDKGKTQEQIDRVIPPFRVRLPKSSKADALAMLLDELDEVTE